MCKHDKEILKQIVYYFLKINQNQVIFKFE